MTFLAPALAALTAFAAVPIILHLYHRRKRIVARFSTNRFFTASVMQSQRRIQLQRVLLMLLRAALCVALGLAVARPFIETRGFGGRGRRDVVILLDDTLSMRASERAELPGQAAQTHFQRAVATARQVLNTLRDGDRTAVFTFGGEAFGRPGPDGVGLSDDPARVIERLDKLEPTLGAGNGMGPLRQAVRVLDSPASRARMLLILTDFQDGQWPRVAWPEPSMPVPATLVRVSDPPVDNVWIEYARLGEPVVLPGQPNALELSIRNAAASPRRAELVVQVNGKPQAGRTIELGARAATVQQVPLDFGSLAAGETDGNAPISEHHRILASLDVVHDPLVEDNHYYAVGRSAGNLPVLLVDGQTAGRVRQRSAFYLATALESVSEENALRVSNLPVHQVPWNRLDGYRAVILAGLRSLPPEPVAALRRFVRSGGGLIVFLAEGIDTAFYNDVLAAPPADALLPARLGAPIERGTEAEPMYVREARWEHEILRRFQAELRGALAGITVRRLYRVEPLKALTLLRLDQHLPLLLERRYGNGTVLLCATAPEPDWSNLPLRRNFTALLNRMTLYAATGGGAGHGGRVGEELVVARSQAGKQPRLRVTAPDGRRIEARPITAAGDTIVVVPSQEVSEPGFYGVAPEDAHDATPAFEPVNAPRTESLPGEADFEALRELAGNWDLSEVNLKQRGAAPDAAPDPRISELLQAGRMTRGVWDWLLWAALLALIVEPWLANRISGRAVRPETQTDHRGEVLSPTVGSTGITDRPTE